MATTDLTDPEIDVFVHAVRSPKFPLADPPDQQEHERAVESLTVEQDRYIQGLRALADFFEWHPEIIPYGEASVARWCNDRAEMLGRVAQFGGEWNETSEGKFLRVERTFGPHRFALISDFDGTHVPLLAEPEGDHGIPIDPADFTSPGAEAHHEDEVF